MVCFSRGFHASCIKEPVVERWIFPWPVCMSWADLQTHRYLSHHPPQRHNRNKTFKDESDAATLRQTLPDLTPDEASEVSALPAEDPAPGQTDPAPSAWGGGACRRGRRGWRSRQRRIAQQIPVKEEEKVSHPVVPKEKQKEVWNPVRKLCLGVRQYLFFKSICFCTVFTFSVSIFLLKHHIVFILLINAG